eukprot:6748755-Prymnesium_polylepis.1
MRSPSRLRYESNSSHLARARDQRAWPDIAQLGRPAPLDVQRRLIPAARHEGACLIRVHSPTSL